MSNRPASPVSRPRVAALNMGPTTGFDAYQPYINLVKGTIDNWSSPYVDANGEVSQLPPGRTMAMNLWYGLSGPYHKVKTGPHVVKWTGGAATLTITCFEHGFRESATEPVIMGIRVRLCLQQLQRRLGNDRRGTHGWPLRCRLTLGHRFGHVQQGEVV